METCRRNSVRRRALSLHRKHAQVEFAGPAILFACLLFTLTAPLYIWGVVGKLFFQWGISFGEPYTVPDKGNRPVAYAGKNTLVKAIREKFPPPKQEQLSVEEISVEVRAAQPKPTEKVTPPPQSAQPKQPDTKVHANAPTRRKTTSGKEREDDRP